MADARVLFVSTVSSLAGGAERSLLELARALPAHGWAPSLAVWRPGPLVDAFRDAGFETDVLRGEGAPPGSPLGGASLRYRRLAPLTRAAVSAFVMIQPTGPAAAWLRDVIRGRDASLVHSNCDLSVLAAAAAARRAGVPYVAHLRDHWRRWEHPRVLRRIRAADAVIVPSRHMACRFRRAGVSSQIVPNPVAGDRLGRALPIEERAQLRANLGVRCGFAVALVARLDSQKNVASAIRAVATLKVAGVCVELLIAGRGGPAEERALRVLVGETGTSDRVRLLGFRDDLHEWLPALDALVAPSLGEAFGRTVVEGMLAGLPVVASDDAAAPEIIRNGETGILVSAGDVDAIARALDALAGDPDARERIGRAARADAAVR
ncbi:MAG: glycosyltransferase family 4 protein, partial [Longimicrobiales bacterium]